MSKTKGMPAAHRLRYEAKAGRILALPAEAEPYHGLVGTWSVCENYQPGAHQQRSKAFWPYSVIIERDVDSLTSLTKANKEGIELCKQIDIAWLYTCGSPLTRAGFGLSIVVASTAPSGWESNFSKLHKDMHILQHGYAADIILSMEPTLAMDSYPLERALRVRDKLERVDDFIKTIVQFHSFAHHARYESVPFFLCKGLEVVRAILPGKTDKAREKHIPSEIQQRLTNSLHNLFGIANNYLDTRHAIKNDIIHPKLSGKKLFSFVLDVDNILRAVVCARLDEEQIVLKKSR